MIVGAKVRRDSQPLQMSARKWRSIRRGARLAEGTANSPSSSSSSSSSGNTSTSTSTSTGTGTGTGTSSTKILQGPSFRWVPLPWRTS